MPDELETILRLVAEGRLSAADAEPIVEALGTAGRATRAARDTAETVRGTADRLQDSGWRGRGRQMRIRVTEHGRRDVLDVRVPFTVASLASDVIPGLSETYRARLRQALDDGLTGPILEVHDEHSDVRIVVE